MEPFIDSELDVKVRIIESQNQLQFGRVQPRVTHKANGPFGEFEIKRSFLEIRPMIGTLKIRSGRRLSQKRLHAKFLRMQLEYYPYQFAASPVTGVNTPKLAAKIMESQKQDRKSTRLLQSHHDLVCRLLLEKKKKYKIQCT